MGKLRYDKRVTVRVTKVMYANLRRLAGDDRQVADQVRQAIRHYLDDQGNIAGSRRYFVGRFREAVGYLTRLVSWHLTLLTILVAEVSSILILNLIDLDEETGSSFTASNLLRIAEERTIESGWRVRLRVEEAINEAEIEEQRRLEVEAG